MGDRYDRYYNGHYDFRPLGKPLGDDVLPDAITACEQIVAGTANVEIKPSPLRPAGCSTWSPWAAPTSRSTLIGSTTRPEAHVRLVQSSEDWTNLILVPKRARFLVILSVRPHLEVHPREIHR